MNKAKSRENIVFLLNRIAEINQSIELLSKGRNQIQNYLIKLEIDDDIIELKMIELTEKIEKLKSMALELQSRIDSNNTVPLVDYFNNVLDNDI